jgi:hypothetical protein
MRCAESARWQRRRACSNAPVATGAVGLAALLRLWPDDDQTILPHDHPDLADHAHAVIIDDLHRHWTKAA